MIEGKKVLAIIPARAGSKRVKNKNWIDLGGKPLISWTMEASKASKYIDHIYVSTDSIEIQKIAIGFLSLRKQFAWKWAVLGSRLIIIEKK